MTTIVPAKFNNANSQKDGRITADDRQTNRKTADNSWINRLMDEKESISYKNLWSCEVLKQEAWKTFVLITVDVEKM